MNNKSRVAMWFIGALAFATFLWVWLVGHWPLLVAAVFGACLIYAYTVAEFSGTPYSSGWWRSWMRKTPNDRIFGLGVFAT